VDEHGQGVHGLGVDQERHLDEVALAIIGDGVVEGGVALGDRLQAVVEVEHHLVQRQVVDHHGRAADVVEVDLHPAPVLAQLQHGAEILVGREDGGADPGLLDGVDLHHVRHVGRVVQLDRLAVGS
jgi:hypothetical protein